MNIFQFMIHKAPLYMAVQSQNTDFVDLLLKHEQIDVNKLSVLYPIYFIAF